MYFYHQYDFVSYMNDLVSANLNGETKLVLNVLELIETTMKCD